MLSLLVRLAITPDRSSSVPVPFSGTSAANTSSVISTSGSFQGFSSGFGSGPGSGDGSGAGSSVVSGAGSGVGSGEGSGVGGSSGVGSVIKMCYRSGVDQDEYGVWGGVFLSSGLVDKIKNVHKTKDTWKQLKVTHGI